MFVRSGVGWTPATFTSVFVRGSLGWGVYAFSETAGHMSMTQEFYARFLDLSPGSAGLEDCAGPYTHLENKKIIPGQFSVRRSLAIQQALETQRLYDV